MEKTMGECLTKEGFLAKFNLLTNLQKKIFLESALDLQKIREIRPGIDKNSLSVFTLLFEAYSACTVHTRKQRDLLM
jgi:hypothetical protein